jgi:hypothetical protein
MIVGIMQPYFLPYIGYWQLLNAVDIFVVYDNIEYTKKGWINRNRFLQAGKDNWFTIPLKKDSDYLTVKQRVISPVFNRKKMLSHFENAYKKSPQFKIIMPLLEEIIACKDENLFKYIYNSIIKIKDFLEIKTLLKISSNINIDYRLKSQDKVIAICKKLGADRYINPIGGLELYDRKRFSENGIQLSFLKTRMIHYNQYDNPFIPFLSIIDVLMFVEKERVIKILSEYELY